MSNTLQMRVGENLGNILLGMAQDAIIDGNPQKGIETYTESLHGFTEKYALMLLKNEAVLVTDEDGVSLDMVFSEEERTKNAANITDWNFILKKKIDDMMALYRTMGCIRRKFENRLHSTILDYNINTPIEEHFGYELSKQIGFNHIAAKLIAGGGFDDRLRSNGKNVWNELVWNVENGKPEKYELALYSVVKYTDCIRYLHKDYMSFAKTYDFLISKGLAERPRFVEAYAETFIGILCEYANTSKGYYHPICNEILCKYKEQLDDDILSTDWGKEYRRHKIIQKKIEDGYNAGWLDPDGKFYGKNGETRDMLHLEIAKKIIGDFTYSERVLEERGWMKIHDNEVYGTFIGGDKYQYCPTQQQVKEICKYFDKFYNGKLYTHPQIIRDTEPVSTYKLRQMDEHKLHDTFRP